MHKLLKDLMLALALTASPTWCLAGITLPGEPTDPTDPTLPTLPTDPTDPIDPIDPADIVQQTIAFCQEDPAACGITLEDILGGIQFGETEPNNNNLSADLLTPKIPIPGQLYNQTDQDWYTFDTTEVNTVVTTLFTASSNATKISIQDAQGNLLAANDSAAGEQFNFDTTLAQIGTYYVVLESSVLDGEAFTNAGYQISIVLSSSGNGTQQQPFNYHDAETEFNDLFTMADPLVPDVNTQGQILRPMDVDFYRIDTAGNEILHFELCYPNTSCFGEGAWAMFVFEGSQVSDDQLFGGIEQCRIDSEGFVTCIDGLIEGDRAPLYYLAEFGRFNSSWAGVIDPTWGDEFAVDVGLERPGTYFVAISPVLKREDGDVVLNLVNVTLGPDVFGLVFEPFSEDQYTFRVSKTSLPPSSAPANLGKALEAARTSYNEYTQEVHIPEVRVGSEIYSADLRLVLPPSDTFLLELDRFDVVTDPIVVE